ncbi:MAG: lytic murein transglycosylase [Solirubrobacterales bacterium]|nr:lytic murein transglycosylase [Solirubrobacterales bacterium]
MIRSHIYAGNKISEGTYSATVYGQPWPALEGTPDTSTGLELGTTNHGIPKYIVAMDPQRNNYGTFVYIWPNPHNWTGPFVVADTGQDGSDGVDIWEWRGMDQMSKWGRKSVKVSRTPIVEAPTGGSGENIATGGGAGYGYPLEIQGDRGGGVADHMARPFGNWMSDNAVDILVPENTKVLAVGNGVIYKQSGSPRNPNANPAGYTLYLKSGGNAFSYMHLNRFFVHPGSKVRKGDVIGLSGIANGVPHLHFASTPLNPESIIDGTAAPGAAGGGIDIETLHRKFGIPRDLPPIYVAAAEKYGLGVRGPSILAAINRIETNFGELATATSSAGAVGWMQFMPATWAVYGVDGDGDGKKDPTNKYDAIYAAANYLKASGAPGNWHDAIYAYNHAEWYVQDVLEWAEKYFPYLQPGDATGGASCGGQGVPTGPANLNEAITVTTPKKWVPIPASIGDPDEVIDARLLPAATWISKTYNLHITQGGWQPGSPSVSHNWGTALDMVPKGNFAGSQAGWNQTAMRLAKDLGWTPDCAASGVKPACDLVPAIYDVYYNGFPDHGDPWHNSGSAHIHIQFECACAGGGQSQQVASWVKTFPVGETGSTPQSDRPRKKRKTSK